MKQIKTYLFLLSIATASLITAGCNSSDDSDDTTQTPGNGSEGACSGQISLVTSGGGLNTDAGYEDLHFFGFQNQLCALNPQTGELLMVDQDSENEILEPLVTVFTGGTETEDLSIAGVAYRNDQKIRFAPSDPDAEDAHQTLAEVTAGSIDVLRLGRDRQNWEESTLLYRTVENGSARWHSVQLNGDNAFSFAEGKVPLGPINNPETGELEAWLAHSATDNDTTFKVDPAGNTTETSGSLNSTLGVIYPAYLAQLDNGKIIFAEPATNETTQIRLYDPADNSFSTKGIINFQLNAFGVGVYYLARDNEVYLTSQQSDAGKNAGLWRITEDEIDQLDTSGIEDTWPGFIQLTDQGVAWGWSENGGGAYGVTALDSDDNQTELFQGNKEDADIVLSTSISGTDHNWVFFNFMDLSGLPTTHQAYAIKTNDPSNEVVHDNAQWDLASSPASAGYTNDHLVPELVSERFLSKHSGGQELVYAVSTQEPSQTHLMGGLDTTVNNSLGIPQALLNSDPGIGLGPYRLFTLSDSLWLADSRYEDSLTLVLQDSEGTPNLRTSAGF